MSEMKQQKRGISTAAGREIPQNTVNVKNVAKNVVNTASAVSDLAAKLTFLDHLQNLSIRTQILSGAGISLLLLVLITTITFYSVGKLINTIQIIKEQSSVVASCHNLERLIATMEETLLNYALVGSSENIEQYKKLSAEFDEKFISVYQLLRDNVEQKKRLDEVKSLKIQWSVKIVEPALQLQQEIQQGVKTQKDMVDLIHQSKPLIDLMNTLSLALIQFEEKLNAEETSTAEIVAIASRSSTVTFTLIAVGIGLFVLSIIAKNISVPIREIAKTAIEVLRGNLEASVNVRQTNEIGILARNFNLMVAKIGQSVEDLVTEKNSVEQKVIVAVKHAEEQKEYLSKSVTTMLGAMERFADGDLNTQLHVQGDDEIAKLYVGFNRSVKNIREMIISVATMIQTTAEAVQRINKEADELSEGATEQAEQAGKIAHDVENMASLIINSAKQAQSSTAVASESGRVAKQGSEIVVQTVDKIEKIASIVKKSSLTVSQLEQSSADIGVIVSEISKIADQTNLLALNAAIEAARAGAQGKGFAVVAEEVGILAERTSKATKQIEQIVEKIKIDTQLAQHIIESGNIETESGITLAKKANGSLEQIVEQSQNVLLMISEISKVSDVQAKTSKQITQSIDLMSKVTTESAAGVTEIAHSASHVKSLTTTLTSLINNFKIQ